MLIEKKYNDLEKTKKLIPDDIPIIFVTDYE